MQKNPFNSDLLWRFHEYGVVHVMSDLDLIILENDIRITCPYLSYTTFITLYIVNYGLQEYAHASVLYISTKA